MAELFKSLRGNIRLASTQGGHVVNVGAEFREVPDCLVSDALAAGCISEAMYNDVKAQVAAEGGAPAGNSGDAPDTGDAAVVRQAAIVAALQALAALKAAGEATTEKGEALEYQGKPRVDAVSELAGFRVKAVEIEEALQ